MQAVAANASWTEGLLSPCAVCNAKLPLRLPREGEETSTWNCAHCGTSYQALMDENCPPEWRKNIVQPAPDVESEAVPALAPPVLLTNERYQAQGNARIALPARAGFVTPWENSETRVLDRAISDCGELKLQAQGKPFADVIRKPATGAFSEQTIQRFVESFETATTQVEQLYAAMQAGRPSNLGHIESIAQQGLLRAAEDIDLFVTLGINVPAGENPGRHSLHVAMVAISIGATWGCDVRALMDLGIGCLIHDLGMLRVERVNYKGGGILGTTDFREIARHPIYTLELLKNQLDRIPPGARMVAFQMHERCNGSGYPRGRAAHQIHDLAKIAAVADVFVALTSSRPHRDALIPYYALERILHGVKEGLYDGSVVRALLKTVSLFPVGSYVSLSDGRMGRVVRTNGDQYAKPVVAVSGTADDAAILIDLANESRIEIRSALPGSAIASNA